MCDVSIFGWCVENLRGLCLCGIGILVIPYSHHYYAVMKKHSFDIVTKTSQALQMLPSVTICQVTMIVMTSGFQMSEMSLCSQKFISCECQHCPNLSKLSKSAKNFQQNPKK